MKKYQEAYLIALACSAPPEGTVRWTLRLLASQQVELGYVEAVSHETVRQVLLANELKPWIKKQWYIPSRSKQIWPSDVDLPTGCVTRCIFMLRSLHKPVQSSGFVLARGFWPFADWLLLSPSGLESSAGNGFSVAKKHLFCYTSLWIIRQT